MKKNDDEIPGILSNMPDKFKIMEKGVDFKTQTEYVEQSHSFGEGTLTEPMVLKLGQLLNNDRTPLEGKKKALSMLAHVGTVTAFRQLERYIENGPDKELQQWAGMALAECRMFLENSLEEENCGLIITGMGGIGNTMRYYFMVLPLTDQSFTNLHKDIIRDEFTLVCKSLNTVIEQIDYADHYVGLTILMPPEIAVGNLIDSGIKKCNELGNFVLEYYYVTNMQIPDEHEIGDIIKIVLEGEPGDDN